MPINTLKTSTALDKEEFILGQLERVNSWQGINDVLSTNRNIALTYLRDGAHLSQDARCHYIEWVLVCDELQAYYTERELRHAES